MAGYMILTDNSKKDDILRLEGVCPCCDNYPSLYVETVKKIKNRDYRQFRYTCPKCKSVWLGNIYDNSLDMIYDKPKHGLLSRFFLRHFP